MKGRDIGFICDNVYLRQSGQEIILLLCGGNKKTQAKDIADAKRILKEIEDET